MHLLACNYLSRGGHRYNWISYVNNRTKSFIIYTPYPLTVVRQMRGKLSSVKGGGASLSVLVCAQIP